MSTFREYVNEAKFSGNVESIKVEDIHPDAKDILRVQNLKSSGEFKMANAITDPIKLVKRAKAYVAKNGSNNNVFFDRMEEIGFSKKQIKSLENYSAPTPEPELPKPVPRKGPYGNEEGTKNGWSSIMNASAVYKGKLSKVIPDLYDSVILLGLMNGKRKVAIIGSLTNPDVKINGLDSYHIPKSGNLNYKFDTGNGYRDSTSEIILTDYVLVDRSGKALTAYKDTSYTYYVFK